MHDINLIKKYLIKLPNNIPKEVNGSFTCYNNFLKSLNGAPKKVDGYFSCSENRLTTLKGGPKYVELDYYCEDNFLTSLFGAPEFVGSSFHISDNSKLLDVSDIWETKIKIVIYWYLNPKMAILPIVNFGSFSNNDKVDFIIEKHRGSSKQNIIGLQYNMI